jgi:hypothetical protein
MAQVNLGNVLLERLGRSREAAERFRRALALEPAHAGAHFNLGLALLVEGRLREGWEEYEWRTKLGWWRGKLLPGPQWNGEPLRGRRICLHHEQGFGDFIQACRYFPMVAEAGGEVIVRPERIQKTLAQSVPGVSHVAGEGEPIPPHDVSLPVMSLPRVFRTGLDSIPAPGGYLQADLRRTAAWAERLGHPGGLRVGLCWQGSRGHVHDRFRSIPLARLAPLLDVPGLRFVSLQKGGGEEQVEGESRILDLSRQLGAGEDAFSELAAVIANLDLVVSVDSAPAHLAGALGRPVFLLLPFVPEWRWLKDRDDSPWYASMRIFRQPAPLDWPGAVEAVRQALASRAWAQG